MYHEAVDFLILVLRYYVDRRGFCPSLPHRLQDSKWTGLIGLRITRVPVQSLSQPRRYSGRAEPRERKIVSILKKIQ